MEKQVASKFGQEEFAGVWSDEGRVCPKCGITLEATTIVVGRKELRRGDVTVCAYCQTVLVFEDGGKLRKITNEELEQLARNRPVLFAHLVKLRRIAWRTFGKKQGKKI